MVSTLVDLSYFTFIISCSPSIPPQMTQVWAGDMNEFGMVKHELLRVPRVQTCLFLNCSKRMPIYRIFGFVVLEII